jgi:hypothetical protein
MSKRNKPGDLMGLANVAPNEKIWLSNPERESKQKNAVSCTQTTMT